MLIRRADKLTATTDPNSPYSNAFYPVAEPSPCWNHWNDISWPTHAQPFETFDSCHIANDSRTRQSYDANENQQYHEYALYQWSLAKSSANDFYRYLSTHPQPFTKYQSTQEIQPSGLSFYQHQSTQETSSEIPGLISCETDRDISPFISEAFGLKEKDQYFGPLPDDGAATNSTQYDFSAWNEDQYPESALYQSSQNVGSAMPGVIQLDHDKDERTESIQLYSTNQERPYKCDISTCSKTFTRQWNLARHKRQTHFANLLQCDINQCSKIFKAREFLANHQRRVHATEECFRSPSHLNIHQAVHNTERSFRCAIGTCSKTFVYRRGLKRHQKRTHLETPILRCDINECPKTFKVREYLIAHQRRMHSTGNPAQHKENSGREG